MILPCFEYHTYCSSNEVWQKLKFLKMRKQNNEMIRDVREVFALNLR